MKNETDNKLLQIISGVKNGRNEDYEQLRNMYAPLISSEVASFLATTSSVSRDDLADEAEHAFMRAALTFDETKNVSFGFYAKRCVRNSLISVRRSRLSKSALKVAGNAGVGEANRGSFEMPFVRRQYTDRILKELYLQLSDYEKTVLTEYLSGKKPREIAPLVGRSEKSVSNALFRIKKKAAKTGKLK